MPETKEAEVVKQMRAPPAQSSPPQLQTPRDESHGLDRGGVCQVKSNYSLPLPLEKERKRSVKAGFK